MNEDLEFMRKPTKWPRWPLLPLKRPRGSGQMPECGFMVAEKGILTTVFRGYIWDNESVKLAIRSGKDSKTYDSYEAIVADGWRVD